MWNQRKAKAQARQMVDACGREARAMTRESDGSQTTLTPGALACACCAGAGWPVPSHVELNLGGMKCSPYAGGSDKIVQLYLHFAGGGRIVLLLVYLLPRDSTAAYLHSFWRAHTYIRAEKESRLDP